MTCKAENALCERTKVETRVDNNGSSHDSDLVLEFNFDGGAVPATLGGFLRNCAVSDADWASDETDQCSISGYCFYFLNSLVSWSASKQKSISLSSTEAEYYSLTHALKEAIWIHLLLSLLSFPSISPFPLLSDNQSACALANNSAITSRSKHIDICHHFIRDHIADGTFCIHWVPTLDMPADIFTKPLPLPLFLKHRASLGLVFLWFFYFDLVSFLMGVCWTFSVIHLITRPHDHWSWSCDIFHIYNQTAFTLSLFPQLSLLLLTLRSESYLFYYIVCITYTYP